MFDEDKIEQVLVAIKGRLFQGLGHFLPTLFDPAAAYSNQATVQALTSFLGSASCSDTLVHITRRQGGGYCNPRGAGAETMAQSPNSCVQFAKLFTMFSDQVALVNKDQDRGSHLERLDVNYRGTPFGLEEEIEGRPPSTSNYYGSGPSAVLMAGDRAPDASSLVSVRGVPTSDRLFDLFRATRHTILVFTRQQGDPEASLVVQLLKAYPPGLFKSVRVLPSDSSTSLDVGLDFVVEDELGNAHKAYGVPGADTVIVAVRPDGVVGAMIADSNGLRQYLDLACF